MSAIVVLVSCVLVNVSASPFFEGLRAFRNSALGHEIIIEGSEAEKIYLSQQWDQRKAMENLRDTHLRLDQVARTGKRPLSAKEQAKLNSLNVEFSKLSQELREEEFCSENDVCGRAFENSFFARRNYKLKKGLDAKTRCVDRKISVEKGKSKYNTGHRQMVECDIDYISGVKKVFLVPSTRYDPEKNLQFFVLTVQNEKYIVPVAYLTNKKKGAKPKVEQTGDVKLPASSRDSGASIWQSIEKDIRYSWIYPSAVFNDDVALAAGIQPQHSPPN